MPYADTNGIRTYYELDDGTTDDPLAPPLVLLHGFTGTLRQWEAVRPMLATEYRVVAYDLRGHGDTDAPDDTESYSMATYVEDLRALLDTLGMGEAHVLGSSFGGMIALEFALTHPDRVRSLILSDTSAGPRCVELSDLIAAREERIEGELAQARDRGAMADDEQDGRGRRITLAGFLGAGKARAERQDRHEDLGQLKMPVLIIVGDRDVLVPAAEYLHAHIPGSALRQINHAGHPAVREQPDGFAAMVRGFLSGLDPDHQRRVGTGARG